MARNIIVFVADGLRPGSINPIDTPTLYSVQQTGINFTDSHSLFPTFTTPNASAIATGHYLGDTGDFSNTIYAGTPIPNANGSVTPFIENDPILADLNSIYSNSNKSDPDFSLNNFLTEESLLAYARANGYSTAAIGKLGPVALQDVSQDNRTGGTASPDITPKTVIIDDSTFINTEANSLNPPTSATTGSQLAEPLSQSIADNFATAGLFGQTIPGTTTVASTIGALRVQPSGSLTAAGTLNANTVQQQFFADATTKAVLPQFVSDIASGTSNGFATVYWSRDPDGTQHNNGDAFNSADPGNNSLTIGINGPTPKKAVANADANLKQLIDYLKATPDPANPGKTLYDNTDIFVTADHGFSTISKQAVGVTFDAAGNPTYINTTSYASTLSFAGVHAGFLPPGFVAIDLAHDLGSTLYDPDTAATPLDANQNIAFKAVDPTLGQRPVNGNGVIGGSGTATNGVIDPNTQVVIAANGGSDLLYVPSNDPALVKKIVSLLAQKDYISGIFTDDKFGDVPGALKLSTIGLEGNASTPTPSIVINFKTFSTNPNNPNDPQAQVEVADTTLQQGQGMHGSFGRGDTFNNMAAIGPDFKSGYIDTAPVSNADVAPTLASILGWTLPSVGSLTGRVISEALVGGPAKAYATESTLVSTPVNGESTVLNVENVGNTPYFNVAGFAGGTDGLAPIAFSGVAAGDMTSNDAILWTRAYDPATKKGDNTHLTAQVSTDPKFAANFYTYDVPARTDGLDHDGTAKVDATGLTSGTQYYYRFISDTGTVSPVGTFKTEPDANAKVAVHFGFSGDADGLMRPYASTANFSKLGLDFFGFLGDTIYETASTGSPAAADPVANPSQALADYHRKYLENIQSVNPGGFSDLETLFSSQGNYTLLDNHELGNKQLINGGAPAALATVSGNGSSNPADDANKTGTFINDTVGFKTLEQAYSDYQPIREQFVSAPNDPRSDGTQQLYNVEQWGKNVLYVNTDTRSYRDVRLKTAAGADDTGVRADNPDRTLLGTTQLAWLKKTLLDAQSNGTVWKFVAVSDPIDQIGAIGSGADGGKSWIGGYRAERNDLLKFIADNGIKNVVFLATDDHQNRINELTYLDNINDPTSIKVLPNALSIVDGPIGATGPDTITDHSFANIKSLADKLAATQTAAGVNPVGLDPNFAGLKNVVREGDPNADTLRQPVDFYSPDTFNYTTFDVSPDGKTLNVNVQGINSVPTNTFQEPSASNPVHSILSFSLDAAPPTLQVSVPTSDTAEGSKAPGVFRVTTDTILSTPLTFSYTLGGTATNGLDYTKLTGTATIAAGQSSVDIAVNPIDDVLVEGKENVTLTLQNGTGYTANANAAKSTATVNIADNDVTPVLAPFKPGNLLISRSVYTGTADTVSFPGTLPNSAPSVANGTYPSVFANENADGSFGVTSPIYLDQVLTSGSLISTENVTTLVSGELGKTIATSFPSKSELALNLTPDGTGVTFVSYLASPNLLDISNSNTPGHLDNTNPASSIGTVQRAITTLDSSGNVEDLTAINAYSGNNGRAGLLASNGLYYTVGNAGNGGNITITGAVTTKDSVTVATTSLIGLVAGQVITGGNIPAADASGNPVTVVSIDPTKNTFNISAPATASGADSKAKVIQTGATLSDLSANTGVQAIAPGDSTGNTTVVGLERGTTDATTGNQYGFTITDVAGNTTGDKTGKDDNFRGLTLNPFDNSLYVTKGSGGNGINTVYKVTPTSSTLPTLDNAGTASITILPGFPTTLASGATSSHPFGLWFADPTTLYVADEGTPLSGEKTAADLLPAAKDTNAGLEKWSLVNGTWNLDYVLQNGLDLGKDYSASVAPGPNGELYAAPTATAGLRNITGKVNGDGTVSIYGVTSTVSTETDQGADPNKVVGITDVLSTKTLPTSESFSTIESAKYGEVLRGVSATPSTTPVAPPVVKPQPPKNSAFSHVLVISIDGLHNSDLSVANLQSSLTNIKRLQNQGITYTNAFTSAPSDSFPGELNYITGANPGTTGVFYDKSYSRTLYAPGTTAAQIAAGTATPGTGVEFAENVDASWNNGKGGTLDGGQGFDVSQLPVDSNGNPVYPNQYLKANTIFDVANAAGLRTAWSDKHPAAYTVLAGNTQDPTKFNFATGQVGSISDYSSLEINAAVAIDPTKKGPLSTSMGALVDQSTGTPYSNTNPNITSNFFNDATKGNTALFKAPPTGFSANQFTSVATTSAFDDLRVKQILNEIDGMDHTGTNAAGTPAIFGLNLQAVSVGEKEPATLFNGGGIDANGNARPDLVSAVAHSDASIGLILDELKKQGLDSSTLVVLTAKHGQNPVQDPTVGLNSTFDSTTGQAGGDGGLTAFGALLARNGIEIASENGGDTSSLLFLKNKADVQKAVALLNAKNYSFDTAKDLVSDPTGNTLFSTEDAAAQGTVLFGQGIVNAGLGDPISGDRTPDIVVELNTGYFFGNATKKRSEHGGFTDADTHVALIAGSAGLSNSLQDSTDTHTVSTTQIAPTILEALGLDPKALQGVQLDGTQDLGINPTAFLPTLRVDATTASTTEGSSAGGIFHVSTSGLVATPLTFSYSIAGTATNGVDYGQLSGTATIAAGQSAVDIKVAPIDDTLVEGTESVAFTLNTSTAYNTDPGQLSASVSILDNDVAPVSNPGPTPLGTPGNDLLIAEPGTNFTGQGNLLFTGAGDDTVDLSISPAASNNRIYLGSGNDIVYVSQGDQVFGEAGNDTFDATDGRGGNRMSGGAGDDLFFLGANDYALGGDGNDKFFAGTGGGNLISGGAGADQFWLFNAELPTKFNTVVDFQVGTDVIGINDGGQLGFDDLTRTGDTIAIGSTVIATLTGINTANLTASNFLFA